MREENWRGGDCSLRSKAEMIMAFRGFENRATQRWDEGIDFTATEAESDDRILLRVITKPRSSSGTVGIEVVKQMADTMKHEHYDKGLLISRRFSEGARKEMKREGIQIVSERFTPHFEPETLYFKMQDYIDDLCKAKCGRIPKKKSDCKGKDSNGRYTCKIRLISDNVSFHREKGWANLLRKDFEQLISLHNSMNNNE